MPYTNSAALGNPGRRFCAIVTWRQVAALKNGRTFGTHRTQLLLLVLVVLGVLLVQEALFGSVRNVYRNYYRAAVKRRISARRSGKNFFFSALFPVAAGRSNFMVVISCLRWW